MTFREATDLAKDLGVTGADIAAHMGIAPHTFRLMRMEGEHGRNPPEGWQVAVIAALSQRVTELVELRDRIERSRW